MTDNLTATPVIKDKFWLVEQEGQKVGSIQAREDGWFAYVHDQEREYFPTIRAIKKRYNIKVLPGRKKAAAKKDMEVYGYPCRHQPHGEIFNVKKHLPIYSLSAKSKSFYCAGHYMIKYSTSWTHEFCPKLIAVNRYDFLGPFKTEKEARLAIEGKQ